MPVENFDELLNRALSGDLIANENWEYYAEKELFSAEQIATALQRVTDEIAKSSPNSHAMTLRGIMHQYGQGGIKNPDAANKLYDQAIQLNNTLAICCLASHYLVLETAEAKAKAILLLDKGIQLNDLTATTFRAGLYIKDKENTQSVSIGIKLLDQAVDQNSPMAMFLRAPLYLTGMKLFDQAVDQNNPMAIFLRAPYYNGKEDAAYSNFFTGDVDKAVELFYKIYHSGYLSVKSQSLQTLQEISTKEKHLKAQFYLILIYFKGDAFTPKNNTKALGFFAKNAKALEAMLLEQGHSDIAEQLKISLAETVKRAKIAIERRSNATKAAESEDLKKNELTKKIDDVQGYGKMPEDRSYRAMPSSSPTPPTRRGGKPEGLLYIDRLKEEMKSSSTPTSNSNRASSGIAPAASYGEAVGTRSYGASISMQGLAKLQTLTAPQNIINCKLFDAAGSGDIAEVIATLANGADINWSDEKGLTPLFTAIENNKLPVVAKLLDNFADVNKATKKGTTPLYLAAQNGLTAIAQRLLTMGADPSLAREDGWQPLHIAAKNGYLQIFINLITSGAKLNAKTQQGTIALQVASQFGHESIVKHILNTDEYKREKKLIDTLDNKGATALILTIQNQHDDLAIFLIDQGANINIQTNSGGTSALYLAAQENRIAVVQYLISKPEIKLNIQRKTGFTPLHVAAFRGYADVVDALLQMGADATVKGDEGATPFHAALWGGHAEITQKLQQVQSFANRKEQESVKSTASNAIDTNSQELQSLIVERRAKQQVIQADTYISDQPKLREFFYVLQTKLSDLFLAYKVLSSGLVVREDGTAEKITKSTISLLGNVVQLPGASAIAEAIVLGVSITGDLIAQRKFKFISRLIRNLSVLDEEVQWTARIVTFKFENQILKMQDEKAARTFAECVVHQTIILLESRSVIENAPLFQQLSLAISTNYHTGILNIITPGLSMSDGSSISDKAIFTKTDLMTEQGEYYVNKNNEKSYGYRLGSKAEALKLKMEPVTSRNTISMSKLQNNPCRFGIPKELITTIAPQPWDFFLTQDTPEPPTTAVTEPQQQQQQPSQKKSKGLFGLFKKNNNDTSAAKPSKQKPHSTANHKTMELDK